MLYFTKGYAHVFSPFFILLVLKRATHKKQVDIFVIIQDCILKSDTRPVIWPLQSFLEL
jgi:hypothetical protein